MIDSDEQNSVSRPGTKFICEIPNVIKKPRIINFLGFIFVLDESGTGQPMILDGNGNLSPIQLTHG